MNAGIAAAVTAGRRAAAGSGGGPACGLASVLAPDAARASSLAAVSESGRVPGSARSRASITGASVPADGALGAASLTMPSMMTTEPPGRSNGPRPSTAAYRVAPSDQRSEAGVAGWPRTRSGAVKPGVPTTMPT